MTLGIWRKPDNRSVRSHQKLVDAINQTAHVSATGDLSVEAGPHGTAVHDERVNRWVDFREAVLVDEGPEGASDFSDNRYWAAFVNIVAANSDAAADPVKSPPGPRSAGGTDYAERYPVAAVNRREQDAGTHSLPVDGTCWVLLKGYLDSGGAKRWVFDAVSAAPPVLLKILTATGSAGQYNATVYDAGAAVGDGTGAFAPPQSLTAGASVLAWNQDEQFIGVNRVKPNSYALGIRIPGMSTEAPPRPIYLIARGQYLQGTPSDPGEADFDSHSDPTADTTGGDTWDARDPGTGTLAGVPFNAVILTGGMEWKSGPGPGGHIAYRYRVITVDADGRIAHWGTAQDNSVILPG